MRELIVKRQAFDDLKYWSSIDLRLLKKIFELLESMLKDPFIGIGKPELLKGDLKGYWSRRINEEHRIVYSVTKQSIIVVSCRSHYKM
jgi:toxin YoeB